LHRIFNPDREGVGELVTRGRNVCMGYIWDEEKTRQYMDRAHKFFHRAHKFFHRAHKFFFGSEFSKHSVPDPDI
jgi:hypothetical protein